MGELCTPVIGVIPICTIWTKKGEIMNSDKQGQDLKTATRHYDNCVVSGGNTGCRYDSLRC